MAPSLTICGSTSEEELVAWATLVSAGKEGEAVMFILLPKKEQP